jgi:lactate dehydrogenase-like 2-hydroxyacid dehydrogenase
MKVAVFSSKPYDHESLEKHASDSSHRLSYFENRLRAGTAPLADGHEAVCAFVNDELDRPCLEALAQGGTKYVVLHCPLNKQTRHLLDDEAFGRMREDVVVLNTSRGALVDTGAAVRALKSGRLGGLGLDVYEEEESLFFEDRSRDIIQDDVFMRLTTFPNVLVTSHQAYFTSNAMDQIAATTLANLDAFGAGVECGNEVRAG